MPTQYKRKGNVRRGEWTLQNLSEAISAIERNVMGIREPGRGYGIPKCTLRRRKRVTRNLGPQSVLGPQNEDKIVIHFKKLQNHGFAPTRFFVRSMAFELTEQLQLPHKFKRESRKAGYPWLESLLRRNTELSIRKSESVSTARAHELERNKVESYFSVLQRTLTENDLMNEPGHIFNVDETCVLNNRPEHVIAEKRSKNVVSTPSVEKGSVIVC